MQQEQWNRDRDDTYRYVGERKIGGHHSKRNRTRFLRHRDLKLTGQVKSAQEDMDLAEDALADRTTHNSFMLCVRDETAWLESRTCNRNAGDSQIVAVSTDGDEVTISS